MSLPTGNRLNLYSYLHNMTLAIKERQLAWQLGTPSTIPIAAVGDRVDDVIRNCQHGMSDQDVYVNPTIEIDGMTPAAVDATDYTLRTYCGLSTSPYVTAGLLANSTLFWRRKKPRTVSYLSGSGSTMDTDNNTCTSGMRAYYNPSLVQDLYIVKYNGTVWQICYDGMPDILDSNNNLPNGCLPGLMQTGDYLGIHLFDELSKIINAASVCFDIVPLTTSGLPSPAYTYTRYLENGLGSDPSSIPAATAQAVANYANESGSPSVGFVHSVPLGGGAPYGYGIGPPAVPYCAASYVQYTGSSVNAEVTKYWTNAIEFCTVDNTTGIGTGYPQTHTSRFYSGPDQGTYATHFNAQTDPVSQTTYTKFGTVSVSAGVAAQTPWPGEAPTDFSPAGAGTSANGGYNCNLYYVVQFTGFAYMV
jgi:hypothetical protein